MTSCSGMNLVGVTNKVFNYRYYNSQNELTRECMADCKHVNGTLY